MKKRLFSMIMAIMVAFSFLSVTTAIQSVTEVYAADDYPERYKNAVRDSLVDDYNFYNRECTSFVAWCLNHRNGFPFHNWYGCVRWGNASNWGDAARKTGFTVDNVPAVGSVAWWNSGKYGHVAYVVAVNGDNVTIEEYNYGSNGNYHTRTINRYNPSGYIHIKDLSNSNATQVVVDEGYYKLLYSGDKFLNVSGDRTENGTNVDIWSSVTYHGQTFYIGRNWNDTGYYIKHKTSGKYIDTAGNVAGSRNVILWEGNGADGQ